MVSAITATQVLATTPDQKLGFTINEETKAADLAALKEAGYTIEFKTSKAVLKDADGNAATTNSTGELRQASLTTGTFDYQVVISKGTEVVATSEFATVKVVNGSAIAEITEVGLTATINSVSGVALTNNVISIASDSLITLNATKGTTVAGQADQAVTGETFKSLNQKVALINSTTGEITPVQAGEVTFEITKDGVKKEVTYTVVNEARAVKTVTADVEEVKLTTNNSGKNVVLSAKDQFGDASVVDLPSITAVKNSSDQEIIKTVDPAKTDNKGQVTIKLEPQGTNQGTGTVLVKDGNNKTLLSIPVTVGDGSTVATRKLETSATDNVIDPFKADDDEIVLSYNQYNGQGLLIGAELSIDEATTAVGYNKDVDSPVYVVSSTDEEVATVAVNGSGVITVTAVADGTTTLQVKEGSLVRATYIVVVKDSTPTVTAVTFVDNAKVTATGAFTLSDVIQTVKTTDGTELFLHTDGKIYTEAAGSGTEVGSVAYVSGEWTVATDTDGTDGNIELDGANPAAGDKGTVVVQVKDNAGKVVDSYVLEVAVPFGEPTLNATTGSLTMETGGTALPTSKTYVVTTTSSLKASLVKGTDVVVTGLPAGLDYAVANNDGKLEVTLSGTASSPVAADVTLTITVKASASEDFGVADKNVTVTLKKPSA